MHVAFSLPCRSAWIGRIAVIPLLAAATVFAQAPASPAAPAQGQPVQAGCPHSPNMDIPVNQTIQARVTGTLDSAHLKVGKDIWVNVVYGLMYPGCTLEKDAVLYGRITEATSSKTADPSELSIQFDRADCTQHGKKPISMRLIGVVAPPEESKRMHDALPSEIQGAGRSIGQTAAMSDAFDENLNPGGPPHTVRPGTVVRLPKVTLEPEGGPGCSARLTAASHSVQLGTGSELILVMQGAK